MGDEICIKLPSFSSKSMENMRIRLRIKYIEETFFSKMCTSKYWNVSRLFPNEKFECGGTGGKGLPLSIGPS
jgi:hypothetical protein